MLTTRGRSGRGLGLLLLCWVCASPLWGKPSTPSSSVTLARKTTVLFPPRDDDVYPHTPPSTHMHRVYHSLVVKRIVNDEKVLTTATCTIHEPINNKSKGRLSLVSWTCGRPDRSVRFLMVCVIWRNGSTYPFSKWTIPLINTCHFLHSFYERNNLADQFSALRLRATLYWYKPRKEDCSV